MKNSPYLDRPVRYRILLQKTSIPNGAVCLYQLPSNAETPYATWLMDSNGATYWGHYFKTLESAQKDFKTRNKECRA